MKIFRSLVLYITSIICFISSWYVNGQDLLLLLILGWICLASAMVIDEIRELNE